MKPDVTFLSDGMPDWMSDFADSSTRDATELLLQKTKRKTLKGPIVVKTAATVGKAGEDVADVLARLGVKKSIISALTKVLDAQFPAFTPAKRETSKKRLAIKLRPGGRITGGGGNVEGTNFPSPPSEGNWTVGCTENSSGCICRVYWKGGGMSWNCD